MFKLADPNQNNRMVQLFEQLCEEFEIKNSKVLSRCYANRLEFGCKYSKEIENVLDTVHKLVMKREGPYEWVSLLD